MICRYTSTFEDYKAAQELARLRSWRIATKYYFWFWVLPFLGLVALATLILGNTIWHLAVVEHFGGGIAGFAAGAMYLGFYRPFWLRRCYKKLKDGRSEDQPIELELTDEALISRLPGKSEGKFYPSSIVKFAEDERVVLIYVTKRLFLYIPKRAMPDVDWVQVRNWISSKAGVQL